MAVEAVLADLSSVTRTAPSSEVDWSFALMCASALTNSASRSAQAAVLRIAQSCLAADDVDPVLKEAAAVLLERAGNRPSLDLAQKRDLVPSEDWTSAPVPLQLDVIRRRLELSVPTSDGQSIAVNPFQREFWTTASTARWMSVSAPTSAGKSFIVKRWIEDRALVADRFRAVYVVPTRALIDEVSQDITSDGLDGVQVHTMPWGSDVGQHPREVYVLTQERLHLLQQRFPDFDADVVFVDEAQKFDDGARGVLLQQVLDETARRSPGAQVIFASPFTSNPEILLEGAPQSANPSSLHADTVTVSQNLLYANQVFGRPRDWTLSLVADGDVTACGTFSIPARPQPDSKRLPLVAVALAGATTGNIVYVNGAADAEKVARQLFDALGRDAEVSGDSEIDALRELARTSVHPKYALDDVLTRGIAFHYGNMPLLLKSEIEALFKNEKIRYLVCTSTLLEGVNLPCRNLFVRGPQRGRGRPMSGPDFWNLAGRAGRWGKEFQGNIVCVDTNDARRWPTPPRTREPQPIARASDRVVTDLAGLADYIEAGTPLAQSRADGAMESVFSLLASRVALGHGLSSIVGLPLDTDEARSLEAIVQECLNSVSVPGELIDRHAGISPVSMQNLLDQFSRRAIADLVLPLPESPDAAQTYLRAIGLIAQYLGGDWGVPGRQYQLAILVTQWMRGIPMARLIADRIAFRQRAGNANIPTVIREVMSDVEQIARFQAPKYLACYQDLLRLHARAVGAEVTEEMNLDVSMMLELGVSRVTEVSLMALGLSRTTTIALSELIVEDDLSPEDALAWLRQQDLEALDLPALVRRETQRTLGDGAA